jgi:hypothetical protein
MFDSVAGRYDVVNDALSLGLDRRWRRRTARAVKAKPGDPCSISEREPASSPLSWTWVSASSAST